MRRVALALLFVATALSGLAASVTLAWNDNSNNEDKFRVYRGLGATGQLLTLTEVGPNIVSYRDESIVPGATYRYQVTALNTAGESAGSNIVTVTATGGDITVPIPPNGVEVTQEGQLINTSVRGVVTDSDTTIIPGFIVTGGPVRVLVRLVGPRLADLGVPGVCPDPRFEIRNQAGGAVVASNDNWSGAEVAAANATTGLSLPVGSKDAAIVVILPPGQYSVVARSNGASGIGLAEVYKLAGAVP